MTSLEAEITYLVSRVVGGISEEEYLEVYEKMDAVVQECVSSAFTEEGGFQTPPLYELYEMERCRVLAEKPWLAETIRRSLAYKRDLTGLLYAQAKERHRYGANIVVEWSGPTGTGKSSSMIGFCEKVNGWDKARALPLKERVDFIRARLGIDIGELPNKLPGLEPGDAVCVDEQLSLVGENAKTHMALLANMEDTLRGAMISVHFASPGRREGHDTSQGVLEAVATSPPKLRNGQPGRLCTRFIYSLGVSGGDPIPLGYADLPWCSPELFEAYSVIKAEQLERTKAFKFHASGEANLDVLFKLFDHPALLARLQLRSKPTKADWRRWLRQYGPSMSTSEADANASELEDMMLCLRDPRKGRHTFEQIWGTKPPTQLLKLVQGGDDEPPVTRGFDN